MDENIQFDLDLNQEALGREVQQTEEDRAHIVHLNQMLQGIFMQMPAENYNALHDVLERRHIVLGGDSCCLHFCAGSQPQNDCGIVIDCNPHLAANPGSKSLLPYVHVPIMREAEVLVTEFTPDSYGEILQHYEFRKMGLPNAAMYENEDYTLELTEGGCCQFISKTNDTWYNFTTVSEAAEFLAERYAEKGSHA